MTKSDNNILTLNEFYMIYSTVTKFPYMDENRAAFLFTTDYYAQSFVKSHEDTRIEKKRYYTAEELCTVLNKFGFVMIHLNLEGKDIEAVIDKNYVKRNFYNPELSANILLLKQTKKKIYMRKISKCFFIVPLQIDNGLEVPKIKYAYATLPGIEGYFYLAFTDLTEYNLWVNKAKGKWGPVKMSFKDVMNICKKENMLINSMTLQVVLSHDMLRLARKSDTEED